MYHKAKITLNVFIFAVCASLLMGVSMAQEIGKLTEPEYNRIAFYLDGQGTLVPLERQQSKVQTQLKAFGFGGGTTSVSFEGAKSSVRFKSSDKIQFVIRLDTQGDDPATLINLDVLEQKESTREIVMAKVGPMGINAKSTNGDSVISINCAKYGEHSIQFVPAAKLPPGEYVITSKGSREGFLFGID